MAIDDIVKEEVFTASKEEIVRSIGLLQERLDYLTNKSLNAFSEDVYEECSYCGDDFEEEDEEEE